MHAAMVTSASSFRGLMDALKPTHDSSSSSLNPVLQREKLSHRTGEQLAHSCRGYQGHQLDGRSPSSVSTDLGREWVWGIQMAAGCFS